MGDYVIRTPTLADADDLGVVHVRAWQAAYSGGLLPDGYLESLRAEDRAAMWRQGLEAELRPGRARHVAEHAGRVVGFVLVGPADVDPADGTPAAFGDEQAGELYAINIDPDHWGKGPGPELMAAGTESLRNLGYSTVVLWVHPDNVRARRFYERRGWVADGVGRTQEVLGVEAPEVRYVLRFD